MKKLLHFLFALLVTATVSAQAIGTTFAVNNINYSIINDTPYEVEVIGFSGTPTASVTILGSVTEPGNVTLCNVVAIADGAFNASNKGTTPNSANNVIESISLPTSVTSIGHHSLRGLSNLATINLENIVSTGSNSFNGCASLTTISFPELITFGDYTFVQCDNITEINIPKVQTMGNGSIFDCDGLASINFPSTLIEVTGGNFMRRCDALSAIQLNWADPTTPTIEVANFLGDLTIANITLYVPSTTELAYEGTAPWSSFPIANVVEGSIPSVILGDTFSEGDFDYRVTSISPFEAALIGTSNMALAAITVPITAINPNDSEVYTITSIGDSAFKGNTTITSVTLTSSITALDNEAFSGCSNLATLTNTNNVETIGDTSLFECFALGNFDTSAVTSIGVNAFRSCNLITAMDLSSLETLGSNGLARMTGITNISLPVIESIGPYAFVFSNNISTLNIGATLSSIDPQSFNGLNGLTGLQVNSDTPVEPSSAFVFDQPTAARESIAFYVPTPTGESNYQAPSSFWNVFTNISAGTLSTKNFDITDVSLSPNPTRDMVSIKSSQLKNATLTVYDLNGRALLSEDINGNESEINISSLNSGVYLFRIATDSSSIVKRIVKQ